MEIRNVALETNWKSSKKSKKIEKYKKKKKKKWKNFKFLSQTNIKWNRNNWWKTQTDSRIKKTSTLILTVTKNKN